MMVRVAVQYDGPADGHRPTLLAMARELTTSPESVRCHSDPKQPDWLTVEFDVPQEPHSRAVTRLDGAIRHNLWERLDSVISFPRRTD